MNLLLLIILFAFNFFSIYGVNKLYKDGMLNHSQFRIYIILLIMLLVVLLGQLNILTGLGTDNEPLN
jgi:choline-glycine betaine transporter